MKCPYCKKEIPDNAPICGMCKTPLNDESGGENTLSQMHQQRRKRLENRESGGGGGRGFGGLVGTLVCFALSGCMFAAGLGVIDRVLRKSVSFRPTVAFVETVIRAVFRDVLYKQSLPVRWLVFVVMLAVALMVISKSAEVVSKDRRFAWLPLRVSLATVMQCLTLGLFAVRMRMELFHPVTRQFDWMLNGAAMGVAIAFAIVTVFVRE